MRTYRDAKTMAKALREELSRRDLTLSHGECLDIVARQFGLDNWNVLAAKLDGTPPAGAGVAVVGGASVLPLPAGWAFEGSRLDYDAGVDTGTRHGSGHPAVIRSRPSADHLAHARTGSGLGALCQELDAAYRGKRLRLQAHLRTEAVVGAATIWLQIDKTRRREILVLDNMEERTVDGALAGTQGWTTRRIVLDVPPEAAIVHYGFYLRGSGAVWAGGFDLREAEAGEAVTKTPERRLPGPVNLDFSELEGPTA